MLARGGEADTDPAGRAEPLPLRDMVKRKALLVFLASVVLFHFGNAAMLPMAGQMLAKLHPGTDTIALSACIISAQFVMIGVAWAVGRALAAGYGRKTVFLVALAVLPVRACSSPSPPTRSAWWRSNCSTAWRPASSASSR